MDPSVEKFLSPRTANTHGQFSTTKAGDEPKRRVPDKKERYTYHRAVPVHMEIRMKAFLAHLVRAAVFVMRALLHCAWFAMRPALAMLCYLLAQYLAAFVAFCAITLMLR